MENGNKYRPPETASKTELDQEKFENTLFIARHKMHELIEKKKRGEKIEVNDKKIELHKKEIILNAVYETLDECGFNNKTAENMSERFLYSREIEKKLKEDYQNFFTNHYYQGDPQLDLPFNPEDK